MASNTELSNIKYIPGLTEEEYVFIIAMIFIGVLVRLTVKCFGLPVPYHFFLLVIGGGVGILSLHYQWVADYTTIADTKPNQVLFFYIPTLIFATTFKMDSHTFMRNMIEVFVIALPVQLLHAVMIGFSFTFIIPEAWTWYEGAFFGALCISIYAMDLPYCLNKLNQSKYVSVLLRGEGSFGSETSLCFILYLILIYTKKLTVWHEILLSMLYLIAGGFVVGFIVGKLLCLVFNIFYDDLLSMMTFSLVMVLLGHYASVLLGFSAIITVAIAGVIANSGRTALSTDMENNLLEFWKLISISTDSVILPMTGITAIKFVYRTITLNKVAFTFVAYILNALSRFLSFFIFSPLLLRLGNRFSFQVLNVVAWGGIKGVLPIILCFYDKEDTLPDKVMHDFILYIFGLVVLTMLINLPTLAILLRFLGLTELSMAKKANMNSCMRYLLNQRDRAITTLKMNRFFADANWPIVHQVTVLRHPYQTQMTDPTEEAEYLGYRKGTCPECKIEVLHDPTPKEMKDLTREARLRILKARKISYSRQYEAGTLSKESTRLLNQATEAALDTDDALIPAEFYVKLFSREGRINSLRRKLLRVFLHDNKKIIVRPRKRLRRKCYAIAKSPWFEYFICFCVFVNFIVVIIELAYTPTTAPYKHAMKIANLMFFLIYLIEFVIKVLGFSTVHIVHDGLKTYFSSNWNRFDFLLLVAIAVDLAFDLFDEIIDQFHKMQTSASTITAMMKLLRILRLLRLLKLFQAWYPHLMKYCDSRIDANLSFAYDIGKGFVIGEREVYDMLNHMIDNNVVREDCRTIVNNNKLMVTKQLGVIQKERPWIATTVKTRQAIRSVLNTLRDAIWELKVFGWADDTEYIKLQSSLNTRTHTLKNSLKCVQPNPPRTLFSEVAWMEDDESIMDFLYENVATKIYDQGEMICQEGETSEEIFIVVTGLLHLSYAPNEKVLKDVKNYGMLPIIDNISSARFEESYEDYILCGNSLGELSMLTNRPYNCSITAATFSQAYVLQRQIIREAFIRSPNPVTGLEARIWKYISVRLAASLLMNTPAYQSAGQEKIHQQLERAFVPNISNYKVFALNDLMEDVILIEGVVVDYNSRDCYIAPCYLPRSVQKLLLPKSSDMNLRTNIETKILIIPLKDTDEIEILSKGQDSSELISVTSSQCLQHLIQTRNKRKRKKGMFGIGPKTKRYETGERRSLYLTKSTHTGASSPFGSDHARTRHLDSNTRYQNQRNSNMSDEAEKEIEQHGYN